MMRQRKTHDPDLETRSETTDTLLKISDLRVATSPGNVEILRGVSFTVPRGARVGVVGESGSGKSVTVLSVIRALPPGLRLCGGSVQLDGKELITMSESELRTIRGKEVGIVYQNALASLNPLVRVGEQIADVVRAHTDATRKDAWEMAVDMLAALGIPDPAHKARDYPHQFSGGMAQRASIGAALVCAPQLLIADEPTTGLDATIQAQVLDVIDEAASRVGSAVLLISHDFLVIQAVCDTVAVMYAGNVLEYGPLSSVIEAPLNPYTEGLVKCLTQEPGDLVFIPGRAPEPGSWGAGCPFADRCYKATDRCREENPQLREVHQGHLAACHHI